MKSPEQLLTLRVAYTLLNFLLSLLLAPSSLARSSDVTRCLTNLKSIEIAKELVAAERNLKKGDTIEASWLQLEFPSIGRCPSGGKYTIGPVGTPPTCSITNHTPAEAERTFARWRRETRIENIKMLTGSAAILTLPIVALVYAVRWYRRSKKTSPSPTAETQSTTSPLNTPDAPNHRARE
jgi:hypothetical protein